jgi:transketolase
MRPITAGASQRDRSGVRSGNSADCTFKVIVNDINALVTAFESVPAGNPPVVVLCDTRIGRGVPFLETREKAHFIRIDEHEWDLARQALRAANPAGSN